MEITQTPPKFKVVVGSYERLLYGFDVTTTLPTTFTPTFIYPSHLSCIKTLCASGKYLASGSTDEHIKLYNISTNRELGSLVMQHSGTITHLVFWKTQFLLSASEDGSIAIYRTSDWERLKTLSGHSGVVRWVSIHESGRVALSVGGDGTLKCWDLVRGLCARSSRLERGVADRVLWSPAAGENGSGSHYALIYDKAIEVVDVAAGKTICKVEVQSRINSAVFFEVGGAAQVICGFEDRMVRVYGIDGALVLEFDTEHESRVKDLDAVIEDGVTFITTCSSDGGIKVWDLLKKECIASYDAKCRLTCIVFAKAGFARKRKEASKMSIDVAESEPEDLVVRKSRTDVVVEIEENGKRISVARDDEQIKKKVKRHAGNKRKGDAKSGEAKERKGAADKKKKPFTIST